MRRHYRTEWLVTDDQVPLSALKATALDDLARLTHRARVVIVGDIEWDITENADGDLTLTATAPVNPVTYGAYYSKDRKAAA